MHTKLIFLALIITCLGCDCFFQVEGVVVDQLTGQSLEDVAIFRKNFENELSKTDALGVFEVSKILGDCNQLDFEFKREGYHSKYVTLQNGARDTIKLEPEFRSFEPQADFEILEWKQIVDANDSLEDRKICDGWSLNQAQAKSILTHFQPIVGHEWHYLYGHYPCEVALKIKQGGQEMRLHVNAGSWGIQTGGDSTLFFGVKDHFLDSLFIDGLLDEEY